MFVSKNLPEKRKRKSGFELFSSPQLRNFAGNMALCISESEDDSDDDNFNTFLSEMLIFNNRFGTNEKIQKAPDYKIQNTDSCKRNTYKNRNMPTKKRRVQNKIIVGKKQQKSAEFFAKTSIIDNSINFMSQEFNSANCSFEDILKSIVDYEQNLAKENLEKINKSINSNKKQFNSFEVMVHSLLIPPLEEKFQNRKKSDEMTFDEIMNAILTPEFSTTNKTNPSTQEFVLIQSSQRRNQFQELHTANSNFNTLLPPEKNIKWEKNSETQIGLKANSSLISKSNTYKKPDDGNALKTETYPNDDNFNEILTKVFSFQQEMKNSKDSSFTQVKINPQNDVLSNFSSEFFFKQNDLAENNFSLSQELTQNSDVVYSQIPGEISFQNEGSIMDSQNVSRDISTQTSFDEFVVPKVPPHLSQRLLEFETSNVEVKSQLSNTSYILPVMHETILLQNQTKRKHILEILSRDITVLPDGRKVFNNIEKIGSADWLEGALQLVFQQFVSGEKGVPIMEANNTSSLYVNHVTKIQLIRKREKFMTICKIERADNVAQVETFDCDSSNFTYKKSTKLGTAIDEICKNPELICDNYQIPNVDKTKIRMKIHNIFEKLYEVYENNQIPVLVYNSSRSHVFENDRVKRAAKKGRKTYTINVRNLIVFCRVLHVLGKIYTLLKNNTKLTKREIFYQAKKIFKVQTTANGDIARVTSLLGVGSWYLNVVSQNGLVHGDLKLVWSSGEVTNCKRPATLIPYDLDDLVEVYSPAAFILVVEKESIFHKLLEEDFSNKLERPFLMITGKGMPNIGTRLFLNRISRILAVPIFILVDCDIYGIRIMLTYRFGAICNSHLSDDLAVPNARWLGVLPSEISKYGINHQALSKLDKKLIKSVLKYSPVENYPKIAEEINIMHDHNIKASIEDLMKNNTFLSDAYLPMNLFNQNFI